MGREIFTLPCSADHEQDWQPYPVDPYSDICDDHTYTTYYQHRLLQEDAQVVQLRSHFLRLCVCFVFSSHSFWTSSSLDVPAGVTQEEGHTGFIIHLLSAVRALIFLARRIQSFLSLVDREVEFCVLTI